MDLINVMTYDLRGSWEGFTGEDSPLFAGPEDQGGYIYFNVVSDSSYKGFSFIVIHNQNKPNIYLLHIYISFPLRSFG